MEEMEREAKKLADEDEEDAIFSVEEIKIEEMIPPFSLTASRRRL
jgi:hypothetical protein